MGINKKTEQALADLKNTLRRYPHIEEVHFTAKGDHYFSYEEYAEPITDNQGKVKGKKDTKKYGFLRAEQRVSRVVGERKFFKSVSIETPEAEIVQSLFADDVLEYQFGSEATGEGGDEAKPAKATKGKNKKAEEATGEGGE